MELTLETCDFPSHLPGLPCPHSYWKLCHIPEMRLQQFDNEFSTGKHISTQISFLFDCKTVLVIA